jgi:O-acetylhomoserine/O-acetylserine sulfhydrylase-like pyridoxal-dependent enzyme
MLHRFSFNVSYPGLDSHPDRDIHKRIADGTGSVLSFTTGDKASSEKIVAGTRLWALGYQRQLWLCQLSDQHALCHVVRDVAILMD